MKKKKTPTHFRIALSKTHYLILFLVIVISVFIMTARIHNATVLSAHDDTQVSEENPRPHAWVLPQLKPSAIIPSAPLLQASENEVSQTPSPINILTPQPSQEEQQTPSSAPSPQEEINQPETITPSGISTPTDQPSQQNNLSPITNTVSSLVQTIANQVHQVIMPNVTIQPQITTTPTPTPAPALVQIKHIDGTITTISSNALDKLSQTLKNDDKPEIKQVNNQTIITHNNVEATTTFPITISEQDNTFTITTDTGEQPITIFPDQAAAFLNQQSTTFGTIPTFNAFEHQKINQSTQMRLVSLDGNAVYEIPQSTSKKLFGFVPIFVHQTTFILAENGNSIKTNEDMVNKLLDILSTNTSLH